MVSEPFKRSGFGLAERAPREPNSKTRYLRVSRRIFPGRRGFHRGGQAALKLGRQALRAQEAAGLDQIATALPLARAVFGSCDHSGTGQTCSSLSRGDRPDRKQRSHVDRRRTSKARAGRASIQSYARQVDEDSSIRLGIRQVPTSQGMVRSNRGLANHTIFKQGRAQLRHADENIPAVSPQQIGLILERDAFRFAHNLNFENSWRIRRV
jgi:hypothetical protein